VITGGSRQNTPNANGDFCNVPYLNFNADNGEVNLNSNHVDNANLKYGSGWFR